MKTVYRIKNTKTNSFLLLNITSYMPDYDECDNDYELDANYGICVFETDSAEKAEWVRQNNKPKNFNYKSTSAEAPRHNYQLDELVVVEVEIEETEKVIEQVKLQTKIDVYTKKLQHDKGYAVIIRDYVDDCRRNDINPDTDFSYCIEYLNI